MMIVNCRYCGKPAQLIKDFDDGIKPRFVWVCKGCNARQLTRPYDHSPRGVMAKPELVMARKDLHKLLISRMHARDTLRCQLDWLGEKLGTGIQHIEDMDEEQVAKAIKLINGLKKGYRPWMRTRTK